MVSPADFQPAPTSSNPYIFALTSEYIYRPGYQITYVLQGNPGDTATMGGALWAQENAAQAFKLATEAWMAVANISIVGVDVAYDGTGSRADYTWVERLRNLGAGTLGQHTLPDPDVEGFGEFNNKFITFKAALNAPGGVGFLTFLHEIGHGLGLLHPHDPGHAFPGVTSSTDTGDFGLNQTIYTVESYNRFFGGASGQNPWGFSKTPMAFDIAAIQNMYGANMSTATGDDIYVLPQSNVAGTGWSCIWDAGGSDTISGALTSGCTIDLRAATLQNADGGGGWLSRGNNILGGYTIANNVIIENALGSASGDVITGNQAANLLRGMGGADQLSGREGDDHLEGGSGNDTLDGGDGIDIAMFSGNRNNYAVTSLGNGSYSIRDLRSGTPDGTDTITTIELARFANFTIAVSQLLGAADDANTTDEAHGITGNVMANDSTESGPKTVTAVNGLAVVGQQITLPSGALLTLNADGSYGYDPNGKFNFLGDGSGGATNTFITDSFSYTITGGATANVAITIAGLASPDDVLGGDGGDNDITGTGAGDFFDLHQGGSDKAHGLGGDDGFYFGAAMTSADQVDGGAGALDQIGLQGNYTGSNALTLGAGSTLGVEMLIILPGSDTRFGDLSGAFYSYDITTLDANVAAGQSLIANANTLRAGEAFAFNGSAEQDGSFLTYGGRGNDELIGGQRVDGFFFGANGRFGTGDIVDGQSQQAGGLDQLGLQGNYTGPDAVTFGANQLQGIEMIVLLSGVDARFGGTGSNYSYDLTMNDGNVAAGQKMIVNANTLLAGETVVFNGGAETDGFFQIFSGNGDDIYFGSQGNDDIWGGGGADTLTGGLGADTLHGGAGNDIFRYTSAAQSLSGASDSILDLAAGDKVDVSAIDAISGGPDDAFSFVGSSAFVNNGVGQLQAINTGANNWTVAADVDGNGVADLVIAMTVADAHSLTGTDFIL